VSISIKGLPFKEQKDLFVYQDTLDTFLPSQVVELCLCRWAYPFVSFNSYIIVVLVSQILHLPLVDMGMLCRISSTQIVNVFLFVCVRMLSRKKIFFNHSHLVGDWH